MPDHFFEALECEVRKILIDSPRCHDFEHTGRVLINARWIATVEKADLNVVTAAALLHDIGRAAEMADCGSSCHALIGASQVPSILHRIGVVDEDFVRHVADCVATHRYRRRPGVAAPQTKEAEVVFDADKLDSMGAVGVGRAFHFAGRIGARLHNTEQEAMGAASYSQDDTAFREYLIKLRFLKKSMLTDEGRRMAEKRQAFMVAFFSELERETTAGG